MQNWYTWTVKFSVHRTWVEDGFDLDDERAHDMILNDLRHAYGHEVKARVLRRPSKAKIREAQQGEKEAEIA
jgi:hypothetical protein